ncbi:lactate utilization protein [Nanoarchaeota archaeon]|nr:MAG: lactate utilization protein [Nanoarchaeota archaeon]
MLEISKILGSKRVNEGKKALLLAMKDYLENRKHALESIEVNAFKEELREIRKLSIEKLEELLREAKENLEKNNINVHFARDAEEARKIVLSLVKEAKVIAKSKSNVIQEVRLKEALSGKCEVVETDCGDFLVEVCDEKPVHPVTPALHLSPEEITKKIKGKFGEKIRSDPPSIARWAKKKIREGIFKADVGLTGANVISADGGIFILENEGNISLVTRIPRKHIILTGIEKVVPTMEDAMKVCKALSIWGSGVRVVAYINVIGSPSKTADISKKLVFGMQGAEEVHLIFVDNGRRQLVKSGLEEALYCINCGACLYYCPIYRQLLDNYGLDYFGGIGIIKIAFERGIEEAFERGLYFCTTCGACREQCPVSVDVPSLLRKVRKVSATQGLVPQEYVKVRERIVKFGNPYEGEKDVGKKWYCC